MRVYQSTTRHPTSTLNLCSQVADFVTLFYPLRIAVVRSSMQPLRLSNPAVTRPIHAYPIHVVLELLAVEESRLEQA